MFKKVALIGASSLSLANPVFAQDADIDTVIVEGSRLGQTATEIGSSVTIIDADDIELLGFDFALDAIASAPGVTINSNGAFGGQASVRIRGAASEQTLVLIDGVPVNDASSPGGGFNFARLDTENIDRIEILKGPQSTLWGTDAIGGVVSITTKRPEDGVGGRAFAEFGSFNTARGGASFESGGEAGALRLAVVGSSSDGISKADENNGNSEDDAYDSLSLSANGALNLGGDARLSTTVLLTEAEAEFDSFVFGNQGNVGDGDQLSETSEVSANVSLTGSLFDGQLDNLLMVGLADIERENFTNRLPSFGASGDRSIYRYQGTVALSDAGKLAFGAEREETQFNGDETSIDGLFGLYALQTGSALTLTAGLRVDDHSTFGTETTGRAAAAFNPNAQLTLRASWGQGFKAPTLFQLSGGGFASPNPDLQPETSEAVDAGIDWRSLDDRLSAGATVFVSDIENQIRYAATGYFNEAVVETQGVELYGSFGANDWLILSAHYAYIEAEDGSGNALSRVPEHSGDITASMDPDGPFSGAVLVRYNGEEQNTDGTVLDGWTRIDITGRYAVNDSVELFARIENLLDEEYQQILGYGTPDRSGSVGVRVRY